MELMNVSEWFEKQAINNIGHVLKSRDRKNYYLAKVMIGSYVQEVNTYSVFTHGSHQKILYFLC